MLVAAWGRPERVLGVCTDHLQLGCRDDGICQFWALALLSLSLAYDRRVKELDHVHSLHIGIWESQTATRPRPVTHTRHRARPDLGFCDKQRLPAITLPLTPTTDRNLREHAPRSLSLLTDVSSAESVLVGAVRLSTPCVGSQ